MSVFEAPMNGPTALQLNSIKLIARFGWAETTLSVLIHTLGGGPYFVFGWGFDKPFPLRPWPVYWKNEEKGGVYKSITWFGFYVGLKKQKD